MMRLTGLITCAHCGKGFVGTTAHGRSDTYRYYTCHTVHRYGSDYCEAERLPAGELEAEIVKQLLNVLKQEPLVREAVRQAIGQAR
jgi:site-specific DNA recombinase